MSFEDLKPGTIIGLLFGGCIGLIVLIVLGTLFNGFALMFLWGWFAVVPFGLPALSIGQAIGLSSLVSFMTYQYIDTQEKTGETGTDKIVRLAAVLIGRPLSALIFGRIVFYFTYGH